MIQPQGDIETTSLATLALLKSGTEPATARAALTWLAGQKDRLGHVVLHASDRLDLPIPAGFAANLDSLGQIVQSGQIAKYQVTARSIIVYLRELAPAKPLRIRYRLEATMLVRITVPPGRIYEYYDSGNEGTSRSAQITVA